MSCRVVVLGAGCFGLASAIELLHSGYDVTIITDKRTPHTTSDGAGALWGPVLDADSHQWPTFDKWSEYTLKKFAALNNTYNGEETGCWWINGIEFHKHKLPVPLYSKHVVGFRELKQSELVLIGLKTAQHGFQFTSIMADMPVYLAFLEREFIHAGGKFVHGTIKSFHGPEYSDSKVANECLARCDLIVNCLGLAPMTLLNDKEMKPIRGYLVRVSCPSIHHWYSDSDDFTYIFPRRNDVVLGGTYHVGETDCQENAETAQAIIDRCRAIVPELRNASVLHHWFGLRPHRNTLRLELEMPLEKGATEPIIIPSPTSVECFGADSIHINRQLKGVDCARARVPVIHNYGAGGSGMTLHWGCANDVLKLAKIVRPPKIDLTMAEPDQHRFTVNPTQTSKLAVVLKALL